MLSILQLMAQNSEGIMFEHQMGGNVMRNFNYGRATTTQSKPTSEITDNIIRKTSKITN